VPAAEAEAEAGRLTTPLALDTERPSARPLPTDRMPPPYAPDVARPSCLPPAPPEPGRTLPLLLPLLLRLRAGAAAASDQPPWLAAAAAAVPGVAGCRCDGGDPRGAAECAPGCPTVTDAAEEDGEGLGGTGALGRWAASSASVAARSACQAAGPAAGACALPGLALDLGGDASCCWGPAAAGPPGSSTLAAAALEGRRNLAGSEQAGPADAASALATAVLGRCEQLGLRLPGMPLLVAGLAGSSSAWTEPSLLLLLLLLLHRSLASAAGLPSCSSPLRPSG
jgi:hypothetical protein